jgi:hypothetical protein
MVDGWLARLGSCAPTIADERYTSLWQKYHTLKTNSLKQKYNDE